MAALLEETSKITAKGQTTIPKSVRQALGVDHGGRIAFVVGDHGVSVVRAEAEHEDPAVDHFLSFLDKDLRRRPHAITALSSELAEEIAKLTRGIRVNFDDSIEGAVDL